MKKLIPSIILVSLISTTAMADYNDNKFYIGGGINQADIDDFSGGGAHGYAGYKFNKKFALELGYSSSEDDINVSEFGIATNNNVSYDYAYIDGIYEIPVGNGNKPLFNVLLSGGAAYTITSVDSNVTFLGETEKVSFDEDNLAAKAGIGVRFNVTDNLAVRAKYDSIFDEDRVDVYGVSLEASF